MTRKVIIKELLLLGGSLRDATFLFRKNDPLRLGGATAFFTTFALPPIIFILVQLFGLIAGRRSVGRGLFQAISETLGREGAMQVRGVIRSIRGFSSEWYVIIPGVLFLLFVATTLFTVISNSLNQVWQIRLKDKAGILFSLWLRARSFGIILLAGILFFTDLLFESLGIIAGKYIDDLWEGGGLYFKGALSKVASVAIVAAWFILLFRFLAGARPSWKASVIGGLVTGILFTGGRLLLRVLLVNSNIGLLYGASGSLVVILLFIFYSSFILYYGACFVAVYSEKKAWPMQPVSKTYHYNISNNSDT